MKFFSKMKEVLTPKPVLTHFDLELPVKVTVDASAKAVGAVLSHVYLDGTERPVAFASRRLSDTESRYPQIEREALSIIFGVTKFHDFLFCKRFTLISDHKPLVFQCLGNSSFSANRLQRWCFILSNYSFAIKFVKSECNIADFLPRTELTSQSNVESSKIYSLGYVHYVHESCPFVVNWRKVKLEIGIDPILSKVVDAEIRGNTLPTSPEFKPFTNRFCELTVDHGCLMWGYRVIVPHKLRASVLKELHVNHFGINKMKALARSYFW